jgi:ABC-type multidrug transport system fused ATPase/permease subunit
MLKAVKASLAFMTGTERRKWYLLTGSRALLSLFDLVGILAIGFIATSTAVFLTSGSDPQRVLEFAGFEIPAVNAQTLPWVAAGVLFLLLAKAFFSVILTRQAAYFVAHVEARSARTIADVSFGGDLGAARKKSREELMYAIQSGSPQAFNTLLNSVNTIVTEATLFIVICLGFMFIDPGATLAAIIYFGLIAFIIQFFVGSLTTKAAEVNRESSVKGSVAISDLLSVFRELHVLGKRNKFIDKIYKSRVSAADSAATTYYLSGMPRYIIEAALLIGVALFVLSKALSGDIVKSAATIGVFLSGGFRLTAALLPLQSSLLTIQSAIPAAATAHEILELGLHAKERRQKPVSHLTFATEDPRPIGIEFKGVSFSYPDSIAPVIQNISLSIAPGSQVALMGPSGAGKSTIADLLCQVLQPTEGAIVRTDSVGMDHGDKSIGRVSYVPQRPGVVSGSILENVALAVDADDVDRNQAIKALQLANLGKLIADLPQGIDSQFGKLQDGLSGGQMQRLGLARALYNNPGLLVMDEATSSLDAESEAEIQKVFDGLRGKVTVVLIAHRVNTIQNADVVFLMEEGTLVDHGTFQELLRRNPSVERVVELMRVRTD